MSSNTIHRSSVALTLAVSASLFLSGCPTSAERHAMAGLDAFRACDLRTAQREFDAAYTMDTRPDFALAYALSDVAVLAEDPQVQPILARFGFTRAINTQFVWGRDGLLQKLASGTETCDSLNDLVRTNLPHPSIQRNGVELETVIDRTLTIEEVRVALAGWEPRLARIAGALETAAARTDSSFSLEGGCGVGTQIVQKPELLALAAAIETLRAAIVLADGYDWNVPVYTILYSSHVSAAAYVASLQAHFLRVDRAAAFLEGRPIVLRALDLAQRSIDAAQAITTTPAHAIFDWRQFPPQVLADMRVYVMAGRAALETDAATPIPFVTPALAIRANSFFTDPVNFANATSPIWTVSSGSADPYVNYNGPPVEALLNPRFTPTPFGTSAQFQWSTDERWSNISQTQWEAFYNANRQSYGCR